MKKIWWSWDCRMRWAPGFCGEGESYQANYRAAIDAAGRYGVEGLVIWGFLRDCHGGADAARRICDYAHDRGVAVLPGVGIDAYGGVYHEGASPWSLDGYLARFPEAQARREDGSPFVLRWPPTSKTERLVGCPSNGALMGFYAESLDWLIDTFELRGFQIEQGDIGLCQCSRCRGRNRTRNLKGAPMALEDMAGRLAPLVRGALTSKPGLTVLVENYSGLTPQEVERVAPFLEGFPPSEVYHAPSP